MRNALLFALTLTVSACGGGSKTPTAPSPPPTASIAGNWTGTATYTPFNGGQRTIVAMTATFTQASQNITGQYQMANGVRGTLSGVMAQSNMTATMDFSLTSCGGTASVSGAVSGSTLRWTVPSVASSNCAWFTNVDIALNR